ncbi:MAG: hypothetical protein KJ963_05520 [Bacteroidetes bacterium]|nr:hypothetical protein [Bacteroidota bacterium]MBU2447205.1 hypothetical protein [Bacteroidota bacterium]MBU2636529.1 hypothetical protein [Bacteroidota bacterium]
MNTEPKTKETKIITSSEQEILIQNMEAIEGYLRRIKTRNDYSTLTASDILAIDHFVTRINELIKK